MNKRFVLALLVLGRCILIAQRSAGEFAVYESQRIVDMPTAGVLPRGCVLFRLLAFEEGGILLEALVSPLPRLQLGLGYSGTAIIGTQPPRWQGPPAVLLRWRVIEESLRVPALAIGLETLGRGSTLAAQFTTPAPGAYLAVSKQYRWALGGVALHGGFGYGFDLRFNGRTLNAWAGLEQMLGRSVAVSIELNPRSIETHLPMLLNAMLRWSVLRGATLELYVRDVLAQTAARPIRTVGIEMIAQLSQVLW